jgi:hypothetical protein
MARSMTASRTGKRHRDDSEPAAENATAAAEEMVRRIEDTVEENYSRSIQESMEFNQALIEIAHSNADAYFEWARKLVCATSPQEFIKVSTECAQEQCQRWSQQVRELFALGLKASIENIGPVGTIIGGALVGRPDLS